MHRWNVRKEASVDQVFDFPSCVVDIKGSFDTISEANPVDQGEFNLRDSFNPGLTRTKWSDSFPIAAQFPRRREK